MFSGEVEEVQPRQENQMKFVYALMLAVPLLVGCTDEGFTSIMVKPDNSIVVQCLPIKYLDGHAVAA